MLILSGRFGVASLDLIPLKSTFMLLEFTDVFQ